jgi:hypothetical protein
VRVLTKYQAEKEICWYHWEVVDAASCCDCVSKSGGADKSQKKMPHTFFKPAPEDAQIGDVLTISDAEWVKLAAVLSPDSSAPAAAVASESPAKAPGKPNDDITPLGEAPPGPSFAERIQRLWKK